MSEKQTEQKDERVLSVGQYLDVLNATLKHAKSRIQGEVSGIQEYPGRSYLYFSVKDTETEATAKCFMWKHDYRTSGVTLEEGMEVIITAFPQVYKPSGGLTLQVNVIEPVGEGALKIAYEKLKKQLESEGLFDDNRKRAIPEFPHRIGVITSKSGAVINDFLSNIGKYGYEIIFVDSRVEGALAVQDIIAALRRLYVERVDVLVVMRGGGSLESFQAFNNEAVVRAVSKFNAPVITGIGHDKDIPLVSLVSDVNVSTPTAVTHILNSTWSLASSTLERNTDRLLMGYTAVLRHVEFELAHADTAIENSFDSLFRFFATAEEKLTTCTTQLSYEVGRLREGIERYEAMLESNFKRMCEQARETLTRAAGVIHLGDPARLVSSGYSIIRSGGRLVRRIEDAPVGSSLDIMLADGTIEANVTSQHEKK